MAYIAQNPVCTLALVIDARENVIALQKYVTTLLDARKLEVRFKIIVVIHENYKRKKSNLILNFSTDKLRLQYLNYKSTY